MTSSLRPDETSGTLEQALISADLRVEGQLSGASNATLLCLVETGAQDGPTRCVYKPRRGERPLWDFPSGTLSRREVMTRTVDRCLGWDLTPVTVWRDVGPYGPGMCQEWIDDHPDRPAVDVCTPSNVPTGWRVVIEGQTYDGSDVLLVHEDSDELRRMAVFDLLINNADRKGGHILRTESGELRGIDHGLTFHDESKVRTVLWGWSGESFSDEICSALHRLQSEIREHTELRHECETYLSPREFAAFQERLRELLESPVYPQPDSSYPSLPWPPM